jgi:methylated-DNA-[protein]-cysteine S-methyltransferase
LAAGRPVDFSDVQLDLPDSTPLKQAVLHHCRQLAWGQTATYGQLAARAGAPRAARAVGNIMARNPIPLIIPCHRVIGSSGKLGGFSAPGALAMKRHLLRLEKVLSAPSGR